MLTLSGVTEADAATYQVVATNDLGSAVSEDEVLVVEPSPDGVVFAPPAFVTQPVASQTVGWGSTVSLSVSATGTPTPTFQWQKNGYDIHGATSDTLTLVSLTSNDTGTYVAIATNNFGSVASNAASLVISDSSTPPPSLSVTCCASAS